MKGTKNATIVPHGQHLFVEPAEVEFADIQASMKYIQTIVVRNLSPFVKRIRIEPPKSPEFVLVSENKTAIAPGLSTTIDVEFLTRRADDYIDRIVVTTEDFRQEIPLCAKAPCADIVFPTLIDYGTVTTKRAHHKDIILRNNGSEPGHFDLGSPNKCLKFATVTGDKACPLIPIPACQMIQLAPKGRENDAMKVRVELNADVAGSLYEMLEVRMEGLSTLVPKTRTIDVHATCTDQALHIFLGNEEIESLDFGSLYHGQNKVVQVMLVNDGPMACNFTAHIADDGTAAAEAQGGLASSPAETIQKAEQPLTISPFQGGVPAFGKIPLEITFAPAYFEQSTGFICSRKPEKYAKAYPYSCKIECEELAMNIQLALAGKALLPALRVSPDHLQFGQCPVNQRRDVVLRLTNSSETMALDFNIPRTPHMEIHPMHGRLTPLQNQNVVVSFTPKALGKFNQDLVIKYCNNLYTYTLRCYGEAPIIGEKKVPVKGLERTGRDFDPEHHFVNPENLTATDKQKPRNVQSLTKIMKSNLQNNMTSVDALNSIIEDLPEPTPYSLSPSAMQEHVRNRQKYNNVIIEARKKRKYLEKYGKEGKPDVDIFFEGDANMGMLPGSGLKSPRYSVDEIKTDRLHLQRPLDDEGGARGVTGHRYVHDENKMIKKKFKPGATTQAEVRECAGPLETWQLSLISVGPRTLDFGSIYVRSQVTKSFSVYNDLPQAILLSMTYDAEEIARSSPVSQVIPSAQAAGFDITMCSAIPQTFQRQIVYTINGMHAFKLSVKAEITPVMISMSRSEINFRFPDENLDRTITESLVLRNPGNAPARFSWQGMNASFSVAPTNGIIRPGASCSIEVTFTPPNSGALMEGFLTLKTEDGDDQSLRCIGQVPETFCQFVARHLPLGVLAVGLPADRAVGVQNAGRSAAVFHVEPVQEGVTVSPMRGRINAEGRVDLEVHVLLDRQMNLDTALTLNIRGGRPIKLPIQAQAVVPNIEFVEEEIDFGQITLGAIKVMPISLCNSSAVDGTLYVNLQPHPEFTLSLLEENKDANHNSEDGDFDSTSLQPIPLQQYQLAVGGVTEGGNSTMMLGGTNKSLANSLQGGGQSPSGEEDDEETNSQMYKITVPLNYTLKMQLTYEPGELGQQKFEFPIVAAGGGRSEGLKKVVRAEALRPRMLFSKMVMDFKTKVVATGVQSVARVMELVLHNADDYPIEWEIDAEPLRKTLGVFNLEPSRGVLAPEQDCLVRAAFMPNEPIEYKADLDVFISPPRAPNGQPIGDAGVDGAPALAIGPNQSLPPDMSKSYLTLFLKGQGTVPKLAFDRREIVLPTVPLGVRSRCLFYINNEGYESLEVKYRLPTDNIRIPLSINFPEGQQLGITKPKIPVEIFFVSHKPISFCANIEFLDNETGSYTLKISGTTENCILTCHHYLQHNIDFYTIEGDPPVLREKDGKEEDAGPAPSVKTGSVSHQSVAGYNGQDMSQCEFLVRWMNGNVLRNQIDSFPQDLIATGGRHLLEMIEFLSGKPVPTSRNRVETGNTGGRSGNAPAGRQRNKEMQKIQSLVGQYEALLTYLKTNGALLSSVRPEHFLSAEQYLRHQQHTYPGIHRKTVEKVFFPKSIEAWLTVILQTIKVFLLNRITPRAFKQLPGMTEGIDQPVSPPIGDEAAESESEQKKACPELQYAMDAKGLADSNVCSVAECILLRWLNFHFWRGNKDRYPPRNICCFDADLEDSVVLATVIQSHVPHCNAVLNMKFPCADYEENAMHIIAALQEIGLAFPVQASDIAYPQPKDMLLFVMFLFQNLPHYVPKTTIVFATMLGVNMTKNIELTNPSKRAITYFVHLEGSNDFAIKEEQVRLEPKQTVTYPVEFQSRFSRLVEGQIVFTSRREGNVHAAAMVFKLKSRCTGRKPRRSETVAAVLYEIGTVDIDLENPFNEDADFQLSLREMTICDENKNAIKSKRCEGIDPFYLSAQRLRVKANGSSKLTVSFIPFDAPAYFVALLGFFDSKAGEFYYELFGKSSPPSPLEAYKMQVQAEQEGSKDLILPHKNMQMDKAERSLEQKGTSVKRQLPDSIVYDVKLSSRYYSCPKQVTVVNAGRVGQQQQQQPDPRGTGNLANSRGSQLARTGDSGGGDRRPSADPRTNNAGKLVILFRPQEPGVYPCTVTLTSDIDIRIYQIEGTGAAPNSHCALTFTTQARKHITQEVPIVNTTDREWTIKAIFSPSGQEFDGPREFIAKRRQPNGQATTSLYPLAFRPDWVCDNVRAQLTLINQGTNETYEYELHGIAEEPLAEEHVVIKCEAREKTSHSFPVRNYLSQPATFEVESDLVHISGPSQIQVPGRDAAEYELTFQPLQAGQVTGCIMFRDLATGHFTWYTVELQTLPPKPQQVLPLQCEVRKAVAVDIQLVNPLDDVVVFDVVLNGEGLLGEAEFVLAPKETATYELVFSPLQPSRKKGTAVFFNDVVGEFWYDLELVADPAPPEELPVLKCELGRTAQTTVKVDNPTGQEVVLKHRSTNKINFKIMQQKVVLPALESVTVTIEYSPSSLGVTEEAQIFFEHSIVGQWVFKASGIGLAPSEAKQVTVVAQVNRPVSSTITFKNPFLETIHALIVLESRSEKGVFSLLNKKAKVQIGPLASTQIPFSFCPPSMVQHAAELAVSVVKPSLTWTYAIAGVAEAPTDSMLHTFTVQARELLETTYNLNLVGLDSALQDRHRDQLSCQLEVPPQFQSLVHRCFEIQLEDPDEAASRPKDKSQVGLKVRFAPLRPFVALCNLVITRASGGRWRFDLKLEATEPEVDDTISIQSPLNKPASVAFRLCNHTSAYSEFEAFFDAESAYEFTVQPTSGVLEPAGTSGTTFIITYKPTEYGKPVQGKLVIQTEDVYWSYMVRGTHPKYTAPVAHAPKVENRLSKERLQQMAQAKASRQRKNFIRDNMQGGGRLGE
eukprot:TRINITY_DN49010_c0_g1_i1.p1 TRINITY_DN49010_c0_g1~~TRINITY_DN49010_c0_g1_i1.p1  ORF type:complete len:2929 (-),score=783.00 TRINITY_DN49010_c0_g1_i1:108-8894(-)